jgi:hypothetical protein
VTQAEVWHSDSGEAGDVEPVEMGCCRSLWSAPGATWQFCPAWPARGRKAPTNGPRRKENVADRWAARKRILQI